MSERVIKPKRVTHVDADLADDLDDDVGDVLGEIEEVLSTRPPPMTGWSSIPPAKASVDDLAEIAALLESEQEATPTDALEAFAHADDPISVDETPNIEVASIDMDASDFGYDEPTHDWTKMPMPPDSFRSVDVEREEMSSLVDEADFKSETLRPSAVSLSPYRPPPKRRVPTGLALGAVVAVAAAIVSYRLGPHSQPAESAGFVASQRFVAAQTERAPQPQLRAETAQATDGERAETRRLMVKVTPEHAYLSIRTLEEREGKRSTGPWPRMFDLAPGTYELVAFRAGHQSIVRRVTIEPDVDPPAIELRLRVDDIYE